MSQPIDLTKTDRSQFTAKEYRKTATIHAVRIDSPFGVRSKEGADFNGKAGDYLAFADDDSTDTPHKWIIAAADFEKTYVEA
jgi:hypothetical protein